MRYIYTFLVRKVDGSLEEEVEPRQRMEEDCGRRKVEKGSKWEEGEGIYSFPEQGHVCL